MSEPTAPGPPVEPSAAAPVRFGPGVTPEDVAAHRALPAWVTAAPQPRERQRLRWVVLALFVLLALGAAAGALLLFRSG